MFSKELNKRIKIIILIVSFLFILVILKVGYIQIVEYKKLNSKATSLWSRNLPIEASRGLIYDANNLIIADNITTTSLVIIPNQIKDKESVAKDLSEILNVSYDEMYKHVSKKTSIERVHPEGRRLSYEIADKISALNYDGVYLLKESKRYYPYDTLLSHVIGYVGIDNQGLSGLELEYDNYLTGSYGSIKYFSDAKGNRLNMSEVYEQPSNGMNLQLTINLEIQKSIERELDNVVTKYNPDNALILVMNPNNGEILGMASRPTFSPTNYKNYTIEQINRNLPIWMTYEPGSTFKIITLAASLNEHVVDLDNETFYDGGSIQVENARIKCWKAGGHGHQTYLQVVENSCNPGFVTLGQRLGKEKLFSYIRNFGFGSKTGIDLNGEASGILFNLDKVGPVELATTAFGQGVSVTPIQQITAVSAAINGGNLYKPYVVKRILEPVTNNIIKENTPTLVRNVIDSDTSKEVRRALESVVANGTGRNAYIEGHSVGGKTGTAQKVNNGAYMIGNYIVSFIGFTPVSHPEVVVYVAIDYPKGIVQYGGTVAAPVAKSVLTDCINILNLEKDDVKDKNYNWNEVKYEKVPNVVNMTKDEALKVLSKFKVITEGNGNIVADQSPNYNDKVKVGEEVRIYLK